MKTFKTSFKTLIFIIGIGIFQQQTFSQSNGTEWNKTNQENKIWVNDNDNSGGGNGSYRFRFGSGDGGADLLTILRNGNVGIGMSLPTQKLHIEGNSLLNGFVHIGSNIRFKNINALDMGLIWGNIGYTSYGSRIHDGGDLRIGSDDNIYFQDINGSGDFTNTTLYLNTNSGNVGIGTTSPSTRLHTFVADPSTQNGIVALFQREGPGDIGIGLGFGQAGARAYALIGAVGGGLEFYNGRSVNAVGRLDMKIDNNGNVGIGTTSPELKLDVRGDGSKIGLANNAVQDHIYFYHSGPGAIFRAGSAETGLSFELNDGSGSGSYGNQTYNQIMRLLPNGNVGIGTTTPSYKLHVLGDVYANGGWLRVSGNNGIHFENWGGGFLMLDNDWIRTYGNKNFYHNTGIMRTDGQLQVGENGNRFVVNNAGNVGIGTTTPTDKLQVAGNIRINDNTLHFRGSGDNNHGLGWFGGSKLFANTNLDGPALFGFSGGALGTTNGGQKIALRWNNSGTVGIGTPPVSDIQLKVKGSFDVANSYNATVLHVSSGKELVFIGTNAYSQFLATQSDPNSDIQENNYSLWVSKGVVSEDYAIADVAEWDDYVFDKEYALPSLQKVAVFIAEHKHLPNIPSEVEVKQNGYSLHQLNRGFLKTIEEMTLYAIEQEEKLEKQQTQIEAQQKEIEVLKAQVAAILEQLNRK